MNMTEQELATQALTVGVAIILINFGCFLWFLKQGFKDARENENFNILESAGWFAVKLFFMAVGIWYLVTVIESTDEANSLVNLTGEDGAFYLFWNSDIEAKITHAQNLANSTLEGTYLLIKMIRSAFHTFFAIAMIFVPLYGIKMGNEYFIKNIKSHDMSIGDTFLKYLCLVVGLLCGIGVGLYYSMISEYSYYNQDSIIEISSNFYYTLLAQ